MPTTDIHAADLSDLLGRFGIDLIAERIEDERAVLDLLDYDIRFGQGFLFAPPRPLRPEGVLASPTNDEAQTTKPETAKPATTKADKIAAETAKIDPVRMTGKAALASRPRRPLNDAARS